MYLLNTSTKVKLYLVNTYFTILNNLKCVKSLDVTWQVKPMIKGHVSKDNKKPKEN